MRKKNGSNDLSVRYFWFSSRTRGERETQVSSFLIKERERERERERTHALIITLDFLSSSSLICIKEIERKSG
jgi:hypothetical protein